MTKSVMIICFLAMSNHRFFYLLESLLVKEKIGMFVALIIYARMHQKCILPLTISSRFRGRGMCLDVIEDSEMCVWKGGDGN